MGVTVHLKILYVVILDSGELMCLSRKHFELLALAKRLASVLYM